MAIRLITSQGFALHELRGSHHQSEYMRSSDPSSPHVCKHLMLYMAGDRQRGVVGFVATWQRTGLLLIVRPRGTALSDQAKNVAQSHPLADHISIAVDAVDSWESALARLQRLLQNVQSAAKGPLIAFAQTPHAWGKLRRLVPALVHVPVIEVCGHASSIDYS